MPAFDLTRLKPHRSAESGPGPAQVLCLLAGWVLGFSLQTKVHTPPTRSQNGGTLGFQSQGPEQKESTMISSGHGSLGKLGFQAKLPNGCSFESSLFVVGLLGKVKETHQLLFGVSTKVKPTSSKPGEL